MNLRTPNFNDRVVLDQNHVSVKRDNLEFLLYDFSQEVEDMSALDEKNIVVDAENRVKTAFEKGFCPYIVIDESQIDGIKKYGIVPGNKGLKSSGDGHLLFKLNKKPISKESSNYIVFLKKPLEYQIKPSFDIEGKRHFFPGIVEVQEAIKAEDLIFVKVSDLAMPGEQTRVFPESDEIVEGQKGKIQKVMATTVPGGASVLRENSEKLVEKGMEMAVVMWEGILEESVYLTNFFNLHRLQELDKNARKEFLDEDGRPMDLSSYIDVSCFEIANLSKEEKEYPYDKWEARDYVKFKKLLKPKIEELEAFIEVCNSLEYHVKNPGVLSTTLHDVANLSFEDRNFLSLYTFIQKDKDNVFLNAFIELKHHLDRIQLRRADGPGENRQVELFSLRVQRALINFYMSIRQ